MKNHKNTDKKSDVNKINVPELKVAVGCTVDLKSPHSKTLHRTSTSNFLKKQNSSIRPPTSVDAIAERGWGYTPDNL